MVAWADSLDAVKDGWFGLTPAQQNSAVAEAAELAADLLIGFGTRAAGGAAGALTGAAAASFRAQGAMHKSALAAGRSPHEARVMAAIAGSVAGLLQSGGRKLGGTIYRQLPEPVRDKVENTAFAMAKEVGEELADAKVQELARAVIDNMFEVQKAGD